MVAGGQGGAQYKPTSPGLFGGGTEGGRPTNYAGQTFDAATQSNGFDFGQGQTGRNGTKKLKTVEKVTVVAAAACMVAIHPKNRVVKPIVRVAVAVVMSIKNFLLIVKQLPVINPSCHLRAYQKRDMQVMVLL